MSQISISVDFFLPIHCTVSANVPMHSSKGMKHRASSGQRGKGLFVTELLADLLVTVGVGHPPDGNDDLLVNCYRLLYGCHLACRPPVQVVHQPPECGPHHAKVTEPLLVLPHMLGESMLPLCVAWIHPPLVWRPLLGYLDDSCSEVGCCWIAGTLHMPAKCMAVVVHLCFPPPTPRLPCNHHRPISISPSSHTMAKWAASSGSLPPSLPSSPPPFLHFSCSSCPFSLGGQVHWFTRSLMRLCAYLRQRKKRKTKRCWKCLHTTPHPSGCLLATAAYSTIRVPCPVW